MNAMRLSFHKVVILCIAILFIQPDLISDNIESNYCFDADLPEAQSSYAYSCITAPVIICPSSSFGCPGDSIHPDFTGYATANPGDASCPDPIVSFTDEVIINTPCILIIHRLWHAEYPPGVANPWLYSECIQIIENMDTLGPNINALPSDLTVSGNGLNCSVPVSWVEPIIDDSCGISSINISHANGSHFPEGTTTVNYAVTDFCGNISSASFNIIVECNVCSTPPIISCPSDKWRCPIVGDTSPANTGFATAIPGSSSCSTPIITYNDVILITGPCNGQMEIERTWTATDPYDSSLSSSCVQGIHVMDVTAPNIYNMPQDVTVTGNGYGCSVNVGWNEPIRIDNCGIQTWGPDYPNGSAFGVGTTTVTYTAIDKCGNSSSASFDITVICQLSCTTAPIINCPANVWICIGSNLSPAYLGYATATPGSNCPVPIITHQDWIMSTGPCPGAKVIKRMWTASYPGVPGLVSNCEQFIYVEDNYPPVIYGCPQNITVPYGSNTAYWNPTNAYDDCGIASISSNYSPGNAFPPGTTTVVYTAYDNCGNISTCSFTVTVNSPPIPLTCPNDIYLTCNSNGGAYADWDPPSYDGICGNCNDGHYIPGFIFMGEYNGHQYYCSTSPSSWSYAQQVCNSHGGYLASINSASENYFLSNILAIQSAWIGLSDYAWEGEYVWASGEPLGYTNWYPGQPNNYGGAQDYVEMMNSGHWNDQYNNYSLEYIMELPCSTVEQISGPLPGSFLQGGNYTVTYQVSDACGSSNTCSFDIIVDGGLMLECPDNIVLSAPSGSPGIVVNWQDPNAVSCCSACNGSGNYIPGFVYMGAYNSHHYYCSTTADSWTDAQADCLSHGGHLAVINSAGENNFVASQLITQSAYIGLSDFYLEGQFEWVNGDPLSYTNWYPGQPNNYGTGQDYVEILNTGEWNDQYSYTALEYVMEISNCLTVTQTSGPAPGSTIAPGTSHTVSYTALDGCGNVETCSFDITVNAINNPTLCPSGGKYSFEYYINSVEFADILNHSGDNGGYEDFTSICGTISPNMSYQMNLQPGFGPGIPQQVYWKIWIDFNMDGDFFDINEYVAYGSGINALSGMVTMPPHLSSGKTTMRIAMSLNRYPAGPCEVFDYGETEDYCIQILATKAHENDELVSRTNSLLDPIKLSDDHAINTISIYPNPADQVMNIVLDPSSKIVELNLLDLHGRIIRTIEYPSLNSEIKVDTGDLTNGLYYIIAISDRGKSHSERIIIQH